MPYNEVSTTTCTWAVSLDPWPNRTWGCARILFLNSAQACWVRLVASVQRNYTRERFCSTLLDLLTDCEKITRTKSHVYLELSAKRASVRTYINMHARKKLTFFYICLLKIRHARAKKNHLGLLLDLSSKDTAIELMYINMHVRGNFWNWQLLKIRLTNRNHAHVLIECRTLDKRC